MHACLYVCVCVYVCMHSCKNACTYMENTIAKINFDKLMPYLFE